MLLPVRVIMMYRMQVLYFAHTSQCVQSFLQTLICPPVYNSYQGKGQLSVMQEQVSHLSN